MGSGSWDARKLWIALEPLAFFAAVMFSIWKLWGVLGAAVGALAGWVLVSWHAHDETLDSLGFSRRKLREAAWKWRWMFAGLATLILVALRRDMLSPKLLLHAGIYLIWCVVQQTVYQSMCFQRLLKAGAGERPAAMISGLLFALVHIPNPLLVPATFLWGVISNLLFRSVRSVPALAMTQFALSTLGILLFPVQFHHGFRIGPGY